LCVQNCLTLCVCGTVAPARTTRLYLCTQLHACNARMHEHPPVTIRSLLCAKGQHPHSTMYHCRHHSKHSRKRMLCICSVSLRPQQLAVLNGNTSHAHESTCNPALRYQSQRATSHIIHSLNVVLCSIICRHLGVPDHPRTVHLSITLGLRRVVYN
jgi:hypothetical protein